MVHIDFTADNEYLGMRALFELLFFVTMILIVMNVIFGLIIDNFTAIRQATLARVTLLNRKCIICSIDKAEIDMYHPKGYSHHQNEEHNMVRYVYFVTQYYCTIFSALTYADFSFLGLGSV